MRGKDFLNKMELIDPIYVEAADTIPVKKNKTWIKWCAVAACLCLIISAVALLPHLHERTVNSQIDIPVDPQVGAFVLSEKTTAKVSLGYEEIPTSSKTDLVALTEEEMFAHEKMYVFRGRVSGLTNVTIDFNGTKMVRCVATISIDAVYKGDLVPGDQITILIPCGIDLIGTAVEDTGIIAQLESGMEGIFMPWVYDENSYIEMNDAVLMTKDLAECGLADGMRWAFLSTERGIVFEKNAYPGATDAASMNDIEAYVVDMLKRFSK